MSNKPAGILKLLLLALLLEGCSQKQEPTQQTYPSQPEPVVEAKTSPDPDFNSNATTLQQEPDSELTQPVQQIRDFAPQTIHASATYDQQVESTLLNYFTLHRSSPSGTRYLWWRFDLNDDGQDEILTLMNWCSAQGCILIIFEPGPSGQYRFVSRTTDVRSPFYLSREISHGWHSLLFPGDNRQKQASYAHLTYDGISYPLHAAPIEQQQAALSQAGITFTADLTPGSGRRLGQ